MKSQEELLKFKTLLKDGCPLGKAYWYVSTRSDSGFSGWIDWGIEDSFEVALKNAVASLLNSTARKIGVVHKTSDEGVLTIFGGDRYCYPKIVPGKPIMQSLRDWWNGK